MKTINYKGKEYPVRTFLVISPELGDEETEITISVQSLIDDMDIEVEKEGTEEQLIDEDIYFYLEDSSINDSAEEICEKLLDIPFLLIEEIF